MNSRIFALGLIAAPLCIAEEAPAPSPAVTIDGPLPGEPLPAQPPPPPPPPRLEIPPQNTLTSKTHYLGDHTLTIEEVIPVQLPPRPAPPATATPDPEQLAAFKSRLAALPKREIIILSATVYDHCATLLRWTGRDRTRAFEAWSNIDFSHLRNLGAIRRSDSHLSCFLYLGFGQIDTAKAAALFARLNRPYRKPTIPALPESPETNPTFIVTKGAPEPDELAGLTALHELYRTEHARLKASYELVRRINEEQAAYLRTHPPETPDITVKQVRVSNHLSLPASPAATLEGGTR